MSHQGAPHVLIFPLPIQSPVNCMLKLAELLCLSDIQITFLNSHYIQQRLLRHTDVLSRFKQYPKFRFKTVSDGLAEDHPRSANKFNELLNSLEQVTKNLFKGMFISGGSLSCKSECPVTVIIADGCFNFALDVAQEVGVPLIYFEPCSPSASWTFQRLPHLIEAGEIPFNGLNSTIRDKIIPQLTTGQFLIHKGLPWSVNNRKQ